MKLLKISKHCRIALSAICVIVVLFSFSWWGIDHFIEESNRGVFGDKFGAINSFFSGLAVAGLIYTIYLQKEELRLQREELRQTRNEMIRHTKEFNEQNKTLQIQRFENTFFNMMKMLQEIIQGLSVSILKQIEKKDFDLSGKPHKYIKAEEILCQGRQVFEETYKNANVCLMGVVRAKGIEGYNETDAVSLYDHYFRYLYRIMKFVDTSFFDKFEDQYKYMAMLRGQLSKYELIWLYYNGLSENGESKMKPLIEKYAMLKNLRKELIVETEQQVGEYAQSAFGLKN